MALPDTIGLKAGTAKVWASSGGDYAFTLTSTATDAGKQGGKGDLGANWARQWNVLFELKMTSAPTDGHVVELYWVGSTSATAGTDNPGNLAGADGSVTAPDEVKRQLMYLGPLILSATIGTGAQKVSFAFYPRARYGFFVVVNKASVALSATAADHKITATPAIDEVVD